MPGPAWAHSSRKGQKVKLLSRAQNNHVVFRNLPQGLKCASELEPSDTPRNGFSGFCIRHASLPGSFAGVKKRKHPTFCEAYTLRCRGPRFSSFPGSLHIAGYAVIKSNSIRPRACAFEWRTVTQCFSFSRFRNSVQCRPRNQTLM